jgi:signal transduction histidine kinase
MLSEFLAENREALLARARSRIASRTAPVPTDLELKNGIPMFLDQLGAALRLAQTGATGDNDAIGVTGRLRGGDLFRIGLTVGQVVHDYGDVCQAITELAVEMKIPVTGQEFQLLNRCLDDAIAGAVEEHARQRELDIRGKDTERLGELAHELRNLVSAAVLAFESIKRGGVAVGGSTGAVLGRSLAGLRDLIDRSLTDVRLDAGVHRVESIPVADFIAEVEIGAHMHAASRGVDFTSSTVDQVVTIEGDRQILLAAVWNLLQNAIKFTAKGGAVCLRARVTAERVCFDIEDACGGLPRGVAEELFRPFEQRGADRSGLGLGLAICMKAAKANGGELRVRDLPGTGCVFTLDLPRRPSPPPKIVGSDAGADAPDAPTGEAPARGVGPVKG